MSPDRPNWRKECQKAGPHKQASFGRNQENGRAHLTQKNSLRRMSQSSQLEQAGGAGRFGVHGHRYVNSTAATGTAGGTAGSAGCSAAAGRLLPSTRDAPSAGAPPDAADTAVSAPPLPALLVEGASMEATPASTSSRKLYC